MSEAKHTPGPLMVAGCQSIYDFSFVGPDGHFGRIKFSIRFSRDECKANACLLAAAPELIEALKEAVGQLLPFAEDGYQLAIAAAIKNARAALAKAGGRS